MNSHRELWMQSHRPPWCWTWRSGNFVPIHDKMDKTNPCTCAQGNNGQDWSCRACTCSAVAYFWAPLTSSAISLLSHVSLSLGVSSVPRCLLQALSLSPSIEPSPLLSVDLRCLLRNPSLSLADSSALCYLWQFSCLRVLFFLLSQSIYNAVV